MRVTGVEMGMEPCPELPCKSYNSYFLSRYVVEVPEGFVTENGVSPGDKVKFRNIKYG